ADDRADAPESGSASEHPQDASRPLRAQAAALRPASPRLLRSRSAPAVLRRPRVPGQHEGGAVHRARAPRRAPHGGELDWGISVHDRSGAGGDAKTGERAQPAAHRTRRQDQSRLPRHAHRADDELPAQRTSQSGPLSFRLKAEATRARALSLARSLSRALSLLLSLLLSLTRSLSPSLSRPLSRALSLAPSLSCSFRLQAE